MDYDIVIVGAGPAGLSFACSLASTGLRMAIVEKQSMPEIATPAFDGRDIALTHLSVNILKDLGIWERINADDISAILEAKVIDGQSPYSLNFDRPANSIDALGYLVSNHNIRQALFDAAQEIENLDILTSTSVTSVSTNMAGGSVVTADGRNLENSLIVAADSRFSDTRRMMSISASMFDFARVCVVCRMDHDLPHHKIARECFHYGRTLAVLPLNGNQSSIVITAPMSDRDAIMKMTTNQFNLDVQRRFGNQYGDMRLASERFSYPLIGVHARKFYATRFALIGDAAVGMHPVTAHGFNLGLSGQQILASEVINAVNQGSDIGARERLQRFETRHMRMTRPMYHGTNSLVKFFTDDRAPAKIARKIALRLANNFPPIKHAIRNKLTYSQTRNQ